MLSDDDNAYLELRCSQLNGTADPMCPQLPPVRPRPTIVRSPDTEKIYINSLPELIGLIGAPFTDNGPPWNQQEETGRGRLAPRCPTKRMYLCDPEMREQMYAHVAGTDNGRMGTASLSDIIKGAHAYLKSLLCEKYAWVRCPEGMKRVEIVINFQVNHPNLSLPYRRVIDDPRLRTLRPRSLKFPGRAHTPSMYSYA